MLVYATSIGIIRLSLYSNRGALSVTQDKTLDAALPIKQNLGSPF
jgi:hypothetical protein